MTQRDDDTLTRAVYEAERVVMAEQFDDPAFDEEAPYGRKIDGTPKKKPGPAARSGTSVSASVNGGIKAPPRLPKANVTSGAAAMSASQQEKIWTHGILELSQIVTAPLMVYGSVLGQGKQQDTVFADVAAVNIHVPTIAPNVARLGTQNDHVGKILTGLCNVTPVMALVGSVLPLVSQILVNHGRAPAMPIAGTVAPEILSMRVKTEMQEMANEANAQMLAAQEQQAAMAHLEQEMRA